MVSSATCMSDIQTHDVYDIFRVFESSLDLTILSQGSGNNLLYPNGPNLKFISCNRSKWTKPQIQCATKKKQVANRSYE